MIYDYSSKCAYCGSPIEAGQKWVREKIYELAPVHGTPNYHRYHAELFDGQELSCWEKHWMETELHRIGSAA
jgi:hypothetical protein